MKQLFKWTLVALALWLSACGSGPDAPDIAQHFQSQLPNNWQLDDFDIEAEQQTGTEVLPQFQFRFTAIFSPKQDLYKKVGQLQVIQILQLSMEEGDEVTVAGIATSDYIGGKWQTDFDVSSTPFNFSAAGMPISSYPGDSLRLGSTEFEDKLNNAREQLAELQDKISLQKQQLQQQQKDFEQLSQHITQANQQAAGELSEKITELNQQRRTLQQQQSKQKNDLYSEKKQQADQTIAALKTDKDQKLANIYAEKKAADSQFSDSKSQLRKQRSTQRTEAKQGSNSALAEAKQTMAKADYKTFAAKQSQTLKTQYQTIDQQYNDDLAKLSAEYKSQDEQFRHQTNEINSQYNQKVDQINTTFSEEWKETAAALDETHKTQMEQYSQQRDNANQERMKTVKDNQQDQQQQRVELVERQKQLASNSNRYNQLLSELAALEKLAAGK